MAAGDWSRISDIAVRNHWNVDTSGRWTMVLTRATRALTLYYHPDSGDLERVFDGQKELRARNANVRAIRVIEILRGGR